MCYKYKKKLEKSIANVTVIHVTIEKWAGIFLEVDKWQVPAPVGRRYFLSGRVLAD